MMRKAVFEYPNFLEARRQELGLEKMDNAERMRKLYGVEASAIPEIPEKYKELVWTFPIYDFI